DRHVRDQARAQQEEERGDGEPRVTDGVVDEFRHHTTWIATSETCLRRPFVPAQAGTQGPRCANLDPRFRGGERSLGATLFAIAIGSSSSLVLLLRDRGELGYTHRTNGLALPHLLLSLHY